MKTYINLILVILLSFTLQSCFTSKKLKETSSIETLIDKKESSVSNTNIVLKDKSINDNNENVNISNKEIDNDISIEKIVIDSNGNKTYYGVKKKTNKKTNKVNSNKNINTKNDIESTIIKEDIKNLAINENTTTKKTIKVKETNWKGLGKVFGLAIFIIVIYFIIKIIRFFRRIL